MSHVFRIYEGGSSTHQGWGGNPAFPYNANARKTIPLPDGATNKHEITSIPSPFARIDLVKEAFGEINRMAQKDIRALSGNTIYHKMVSEALDVGEIFFNFDNLSDKVEIITWDPHDKLVLLSDSESESHRFLADALNKFLESDARTYNFDGLRNVYILNYKEGPDQINIIGATSPATLFFGNANAHNYISGITFSNNDKPFDDDYRALYERDIQFLKALYALRLVIPDFSGRFRELDEYINLSFNALKDNRKKDLLRAVTPETVREFEEIEVNYYRENYIVEVLGHPLLKKKRENPAANDFTIKPDRKQKQGENLPLVLPVSSGSKYIEMHYTNGLWDKTYKAPVKDDVAIGDRRLPEDGSTYPYLTISDFLEDSIIMVRHDFDSARYFDGNVGGNTEEQTTFLMPLKPLYFKYFTPETLKRTFGSEKATIEMKVAPGRKGVTVTLRIPVSGNGKLDYIEYERSYYADQPSSKIDAVNNDGNIVEYDFNGLLMPHVRFRDEAEALYTAACISDASKEFGFEFYNGDTALYDIPADIRNQAGQYAKKAKTYTVSGHNFEYVRVTMPDTSLHAVIVPLFKPQQQVKTYEVAIDLGTSNTHIEYRSSEDRLSSALSYSASEGIYSTFFKQHIENLNGRITPTDLKAEMTLIAGDFLPESLGDGGDFSFPTRTALSTSSLIDWTLRQRPYGMQNLALTYNKRDILPYNARPIVNIKWNSDRNARDVMRAYIQSIMLLVRNKVIAGDGALSKTKIIWFYPNSMSANRLDSFKEIWDELYALYFNPQGHTLSLSESVAPIHYYFGRYSQAKDLVNVDIGGGTTDIAFAGDGVVKYVTSFKFAANSLYEDSFAPQNERNGIIDAFKGSIRNLLEKEGKTELLSIFDKKTFPADMASFLFSLRENTLLKELNPAQYDLNEMLKADTRFKISFYIFYAAIIYHIALLVKAKDLEMPRHIAFSGNGSKVVSILSNNPSRLARLSKVIFEHVLGKPYDKELEILGLEKNNNPKESTSKGGLIAGVSSAGDDIEKVILKDSFGGLVGPEDTFETISGEDIDRMVESVKDFYDFVLDKLPLQFSLKENFGIDDQAVSIAKKISQRDITTHLERGIKDSILEAESASSRISDALSFYPVKGFLQTLSEELQKD